MSDEYSIGNRFLCEKIDEREYWRKMARLHGWPEQGKPSPASPPKDQPEQQ